MEAEFLAAVVLTLDNGRTENSEWDVRGYLFSGRNDIVAARITEGVTAIGFGTFRGCSSLSSVVIPEGVATIGPYAFQGCSSLASVTIPEGVTWIGASAFRGCSLLASVAIPEGVREIAADAFLDCSSLASVKIPESVTTIGAEAFADCSSLTSVVIPEGVTTIGRDAFFGCSSLTSVVIPEGVTRIRSGAFEGCSSLASVTIPDGVATIGFEAFYGCTSLVAVSLPRGLRIPEQPGADCFDPDNNIKLLVMHYRDYLLWEQSAQSIAPNAVIVVFKHDDGRIEVEPGPAARLLPAIASPVANNIIADPRVLTPFWNSVVPAQRARLQQTVLELRRWQKGIPTIAILAILDFILGNSSTIDRLIRSRGTRALASAGDLHDWTR